MRKLMFICLAVALIMAILDATYCEKVEPEKAYPMANQHIVWMHEIKNP